MTNDFKKDIKIAVTGGIGSGKSTVMQIIRNFGYKTISLDEVYAELLCDEEFVKGINKRLGLPEKLQNGKAVLDKNAVSEKVFTDSAALKALDDYTHPAIMERAFKEGGKGVVFYEVPLLFESGFERLFDKVVVVLRDKASRLKSAALRDGKTEEDISARIKNQFDYENNDLSLHMIIRNDGDLSSLKDSVGRAINEIEKT